MASPLPNMETILHNVLRHKYYTLIDGKDAYEQIRIEPEDVPNTMFNTPDGTMIHFVMQQDESTDTSVVTAPESPPQQPVGIPLRNLPTMTTEVDRLNILELSLTEERAKTDWIENQLNRPLALLDPTGENGELAPPGEAPSVQAMDEDTLSEMNMARGFQMRPSNPSDF
ncbi:hypothetical protein M422DRAFT_275580 [Sphaerobolus stellatus SS14]|uniref:Uncharacterized protein n=1 Tax=Sphaerobolus stellatus (strain SS14) TaxID=990650 RepID=A0A0C9UE69_SPHS4|nr:hypothetical protein M422DRAFT_275580 [Sphaerobolus stellatus SS14]